MEAWLDWARGPAFRFAIALLILGLLRHVVVIVVSIRTMRSRAADKSLPVKQLRKTTFSWLFPVGHLRHKPFFSISSVVFHAGVVLAPLFLTSHVVLLNAAIGISWPTLPAVAADALTLLALAGLLCLFLVRVGTREGRGLSRAVDHWILGLVALPFVSGFLAAHPGLNPFPFQATLLVHVLSANLALALTPFSKLAHLVFLPATHLVTEVGWRFVPDAGEKVARALGKENQAI